MQDNLAINESWFDFDFKIYRTNQTKVKNVAECLTMKFSITLIDSGGFWSLII